VPLTKISTVFAKVIARDNTIIADTEIFRDFPSVNDSLKVKSLNNVVVNDLINVIESSSDSPPVKLMPSDFPRIMDANIDETTSKDIFIDFPRANISCASKTDERIIEFCLYRRYKNVIYFS